MKTNHISIHTIRRPFIKVCGLTYAGSVDCAAAYGADYVGFNFCPGNEHYVSPTHAAGMPTSHVKRVGVFCGGGARKICRTMQEARLHLAQLQENCTMEDACAIGPQRVIRALHLGKESTAAELQRELDDWAPYCLAFLVEAEDAALLSAVHFPRPWILSGRVAPAALQNMLRTCHPDGVDIESPVGCVDLMNAMRAVS